MWGEPDREGETEELDEGYSFNTLWDVTEQEGENVKGEDGEVQQCLNSL